jgi:hypothetical protein
MTQYHVPSTRVKMTSLINQDGRDLSIFPSVKRNSVNQAKLRSYNTAPRYKYGFEVPRTYEQALRLDKRNGNTLWGDATVLELTQIDECVTFTDKGHHTKVKAPIGYKKI